MSLPDSQNPATDPVDPNIGTVSNVSSFGLDVINVIRGFCMGAADTVPGVSGGTVALILGHYQRLIGAISRVDKVFIEMLISRKWRSAFNHIDGRFVTALGFGILAGIVTLAGLMHWLLDHHMPQTFAVFFGLILASVWIVRRYITRWTIGCVVGCVLGVVAAIAIGRLSPTDGGDSLPYLFLSASVAICAMILPGISGAFILLLLGVYHPITGMIKGLAKGDFTAMSLLQLSVFAAGCLFGLLAFSRLLRFMLRHHKNVTMATLIGLMLGSVEKLWPLQIPTPETAGLKMKERVMQIIPPGEWPGSVAMLAVLALAAASAVIVLERIATRGAVSIGHDDAD